MSLFQKTPSTTPNQQAPTPLAPLQIADVQQAVPQHLRTQVTQHMVDTLNQIASDPETAEYIRNNFISYTNVLKDGKFKTEDYISAVTYCSYKLMGYTNDEAWTRTFPNRANALIAKGTSPKDKAAHVAAYNKGKLVNLIMEQTMVPSWVLNQDIYQKAINTQFEIMTDPTILAKDRTAAANSILTHLGKPKEANIQINMGETESAGMKEMRNMLAELAENQRKAILDGNMKTIDVAASRITRDDNEPD